MQKVVQVIETAREKEVHEAPHRVLEYVLQISGFLTHLMTHDPFEGTRVLRRLYDEIEEIKQYEYSCEIELYPMLQYVKANSAKEAIELVEKQMQDEKFLNELDSRDFHCTSANIVKETKEYKNWRESHKEQS